MINRDSAAERAKAIQVAIDRFKRQKKAVPEYLLKLAGEKPEAAPAPEPAPEPEVVDEVTVTIKAEQSEAPVDTPEVDSADDEKAADQPEKPVVKRGRPPRR